MHPMNYEDKKQRIVRQIKETKQIGLNKESSNLFRSRKHVSTLDVRDFTSVLKVTKEYIEVEGMTTYDSLTKESLKFGVMPTVVPQLKSITVGGAIAGIGIESSSFKWGLVHEGVLEMDVLLSDGRVIVASRTMNADLFYAMPNSYGTLGYILKVTLKAIPVKRYVHLTHHRFSNHKEYFTALKKLSTQKIDFLDGTVFSLNEMYISVGKFIDTSVKLSNYTHMNIYYQSIRRKKEDFLTTYDYLWRWDTDWFWCSKHFGVQHPLIRYLTPKQWLNSVTYWKIMMWNRKHPLFGKFISSIQGKRESIIQDVGIPIQKAHEFFDFYFSTINMRPLWTCPFKGNSKFPLFKTPNSLMVNFGFWDTKKSKKQHGHYNLLIEQKVEQLGGRKSLYSDSFYPKPEFYALYNGALYARLKKKYDPAMRLKTLYQKCVAKANI